MDQHFETHARMDTIQVSGWILAIRMDTKMGYSLKHNNLFRFLYAIRITSTYVWSIHLLLSVLPLVPFV